MNPVWGVDGAPFFRSDGAAIADCNGDVKPDILISNKRGVMLFIQKCFYNKYLNQNHSALEKILKKIVPSAFSFYPYSL